ncbi:MAG: OmpW family outer membrane protein [Bacteroidota bacterium]
MKKSKILLIGIFMMLFGVTSFGQGGGVWNFDWSMGFPMGDMKDFTEQPSFRGFQIEGRSFVTANIAVGGMGSWNVFYENFGWTTQYTDDNKTIYGYKRRYLNVMPLMVTGHYYFGQNGIQPYIGAGLGTYYIESRDFMGIYYVQGKDWHFGIAPEIGILMPVGMGNTGININFKYNMAAKTKEQQSYTWLGVNVGLSYIF